MARYTDAEKQAIIERMQQQTPKNMSFYLRPGTNAHKRALEQEEANRKKAMAIKRKYLRILCAIKHRIRAGDKDACTEQINQLAAFDEALHATGWRLRDDYDKRGRTSLVKITEEWLEWNKVMWANFDKAILLLKEGDHVGYRKALAILPERPNE